MLAPRAVPRLLSRAGRLRAGIRRPLSQIPLQGAPGVHKEEPASKPERRLGTVDFYDTKVAYGSLPTSEILRALVVFHTCSIKPLVQNADTLLKRAYAVFGRGLTEAVVRHTFFRHFCAGETATTIRPRVESLRKGGVGSILDFAAEADIHQMASDTTTHATTQAYTGGEIQCRVYDYQNERMCDAHVETFLECIRAVKDVSPEGFAAIKVRDAKPDS
jgi:proline dehydrogenase